MIRFITAFALVWCALLAWAWFDRQDWFWTHVVRDRWPLLLATLLGAPVVAAWFTLDTLERLRPRRIFDPRVRSFAPVVIGLGAGALSVVLAAGALALPASGVQLPLSVRAADLLAVTIAPALATLAAALLLARARPGHCVHCSYDLAGAPSATCPECGSVGSHAAGRPA